MSCVILTSIGLKTVFGTGRCESFCHYVVMSERLGFVGNVAVATSRARMCAKACALAGGGCYYCIIAVTERRYLRLLNENGIAGRTLFTYCKTSVGTGRLLSLKLNLGMTESYSEICCVAVFTYGASISSTSTVCTGGSCYYSIIGMCIFAVRNGKIITGVVGALDG